MRSNKELLQLLLDNKTIFKTGLCNLSFDLYKNKTISIVEYKYLIKYIRENTTTHSRKIGCLYYWSVGDWKIREQWLRQQIKD